MDNVLSLVNISPDAAKRLPTKIENFDKLLGGGFVQGSTILFAGEPGVGKSTFLLQIAQKLAEQNYKVLYASGEETLGQIKLRAIRLSVNNPEIWCSEIINLEKLFEIIKEVNPEFIIVDSLQMIYSKALRQPPGSPSQMRYCLASLIEYTKTHNKILVAIGHATKAGLVAGIMTLQHMTDAVFFMTLISGDLRQIYSRKNRFGASQIAWRIRMTPVGVIDASYEITDEQAEGKSIIISYESIREILARSFFNSMVIHSDFKYLFEKKFGKTELNKIKGYDAVYHLDD